ncbi:hypothetical protein C9374_011117 [Naegleria lovaniensis]|uniref:Uncharacterized protein n=1 Tax=Naegleria lovaniensis TaxID=51637 RepID=A0AA88GFP6_NAELO|nr:uncharacterized protein C9374_011117 [Naegleria lovaniensis]KAG2374038.1 hypothetical protein C9374_011117 [Naegleria lovaniensis]
MFSTWYNHILVFFIYYYLFILGMVTISTCTTSPESQPLPSTQQIPSPKNVLIISLPYPGHVLSKVELMDALSHSSRWVGNITLMSLDLALNVDPRLIKWYSCQNDSGFHLERKQQEDDRTKDTTTSCSDSKKIHLIFPKSTKSNHTEEYRRPELYAQLMSQASKLNVQQGLEMVFEKAIYPIEKLFIENLELVEMESDNYLLLQISSTRLNTLNSSQISMKIIPFGDRKGRLEQLTNWDLSEASPLRRNGKFVKRFVRIRNDPSQTLFEHLNVDMVFFAIQGIVAKSKVSCSKIYGTVLPQSLFHYPAFTADKLEYFTNPWKRLTQMPFLVLKGMLFGKRLLSLMDEYFSLDEHALSEKACARFQIYSFGFEFTSKSSQQLNTFLVGPFIHENHIQNEMERLQQLNIDKSQHESGYFGLLEWINSQHDIMLSILGSTTLMDRVELHKFMTSVMISIERNPNISILLSLGTNNLQTFHSLLLDQGSSDDVHRELATDISSLLTHPRFRLLKGFVPQRGLLSLNKIKIFLTHCGANSVAEALYFGKLLLGMPFSFDHVRIANAIQEFGVGISLYTSKGENYSIEKMSHAIKELLYLPETSVNFESALRRVKTLMKHSGGMKKVVDIIEMMLEMDGDLSWTIPDRHLTWYQYYWLDIVIFYLGLACIVVKIIICTSVKLREKLVVTFTHSPTSTKEKTQ